MRIRKRGSFLVIVAAVLICLFLFAAQYFYRTVLRLPSVLVLLDLQFGWTPPSQAFHLFAHRSLIKSTRPISFEEESKKIDDSVSWKGRTSTIGRFLSETNTKAFLVVQDGRVSYERYADTYDQRSKFASYSVAKSYVATLVGAALLDGKIRSLKDSIGDYLAPGDVAEEYRKVTLEQLRSMRSGIDVDERYDTALSPVVQMYLTTDLNHFLSGLSGFRYAAGQRFEYRSIDSLVLAQVLSRATGMALTEYAQQKIWDPSGAVDDATWSVDSSEHDVEKAFCCLNATARDFARIGTLYLAEGLASGNRIVSEAWARAPSAFSNRSAAMAYSDGCWIPPDNSRDRDFAAIGIYGQYVYVNPLTRTIIVKFSDYDAEKDELATLMVLRRIAHSVSGVW